MSRILLQLILAAAGGVAGFFAFGWLLTHYSLYGGAIPGVLVGLTAGFIKVRGVVSPILCGLIALGAGLYADWYHLRNAVIPSFADYLPEVLTLPPLYLLMLALGGSVGFWVPFRNRKPKTPAARRPPDPAP